MKKGKAKTVWEKTKKQKKKPEIKHHSSHSSSPELPQELSYANKEISKIGCMWSLRKKYCRAMLVFNMAIACNGHPARKFQSPAWKKKQCFNYLI